MAHVLVRDRCGTCGGSLFAGERWYTIHEGRRALKVCRGCLEDSLGRLDSEARYQVELLEATWELTPRQTGAIDDGGVGVP
jgi:hypothetical protein